MESTERFDATRGNLRSWLLTQSHARAVETIRSLTARRQREINDAHKAARGAYDMQHEAWDVVLAEDVKKALGELPRRSAAPSNSRISKLYVH